MSVDKQSMTREEIIKWRLAKMREMAEKMKGRDLTALAKAGKYIRIGGEAYRAVSLNDDSPLCGFSDVKSMHLETIDNHFLNNIKPLDKDVLKNKEERRLQCWLIKKALINNRDIRSALDLNNSVYDELIFALDEISLGDKNHPHEEKECPDIVRCDILAVGVKGSSAFPVLIELKSNRAMKVLETQLENFCKEIITHKIEFSSLLESCTGKKVRCDKPRKMIVWPKNDSEQAITHRSELNEKKIDVIEYTVTGSNMEDMKFRFF